MSDLQVGDVLRGSYVGAGAPTPFDLPNIGNLATSEIENYIKSKIRDDLEVPETFEKINRIFKESIVYLEKELFFTKEELNRFKRRKPFHSLKCLVEFLMATKSKSGRMSCVIAKVFQSFYDCDERFNDRIREIKEKTQGVIDGKLFERLKISKSNEDEFSGEEFFRGENNLWRRIPYKLKKRVKSVNSTVSKEIRDPDYFSVEETSDMHGLTFEVERKEDILPLMQMISGYAFKKEEFEIKNDKGLFSLEEIFNNTEINDKFRHRLMSGTKERNKPESGDVSDIKLFTPKKKGKGIENMNIEIKFVVSKNGNEKGANMHGVYNYAKKLQERIRLEGFISHDYIDRVAGKFLENLSDLLVSNVGREEEEGDDTYPYKKELFNDLKSKNFIDSSLSLNNSHTKSNIDKYIRSGLVQYYRSSLIPVTVNRGKKTYYSNKRAVEMSDNSVGGDQLKSILV